MTPSLEESINWVHEGTALCKNSISSFNEDQYRERSELDGWTRKHVVAHLAANAEAVSRLMNWARTGIENRMYSSREQRNAEIEAGAKLRAEELTSWFEQSASCFADTINTLPNEAWLATVVTAQGRSVPATEIPWMRSREVLVHAVDLGSGLTFADLPDNFLTALRDDIIKKRGASNIPEVYGSMADFTAYLAGRASSGVTTKNGGPAPPLPPWL